MLTLRVALFPAFLGACTAAPQPQVNVACGPGTGGEAAAPNGGTPGTGGNTPGGGGSAAGTGGNQAGAGGSSGAGGVEPPGQWTNVTSNLAGLASECGNLYGVFIRPGDDRLIAGVTLQGLWSSRDAGASWEAMGTGAGSDVITNAPTTLTFDPDHPEIFYEAGIYHGAGGYKTLDDGVTFNALGDLFHSDLVSVDFTDPERKLLLAGGHEQSQVLRRSTDGGATWTDIGSALPAGANCTNVHVLDAQTYLMGCERGHPGILRSADAGASWTPVSDFGGARQVLRASDGTLYWANADDASLARSSDDGATWETVAISAGRGTYPVHPIELPDGRIATLGHDHVVVSDDHGDTWNLASATTPYTDSFGVVYSAPKKAFFIWHWTCGQNAPVPDDAITSFPFDYETQ